MSYLVSAGSFFGGGKRFSPFSRSELATFPEP
jgi:hypothetical protein